MFFFEAFVCIKVKYQYLYFARDTCGFLEKTVIVALKIHGILNFLPFGTGSIIAKNSGTDDEVIVQLKNVRILSDKVHRQFIRVLFDPLNATLICIVYAWNCQLLYVLM